MTDIAGARRTNRHLSGTRTTLMSKGCISGTVPRTLRGGNLSKVHMYNKPGGVELCFSHATLLWKWTGYLPTASAMGQ